MAHETISRWTNEISISQKDTISEHFVSFNFILLTMGWWAFVLCILFVVHFWVALRTVLDCNVCQMILCVCVCGWCYHSKSAHFKWVNLRMAREIFNLNEVQTIDSCCAEHSSRASAHTRRISFMNMAGRNPNTNQMHGASKCKWEIS